MGSKFPVVTPIWPGTHVISGFAFSLALWPTWYLLFPNQMASFVWCGTVLWSLSMPKTAKSLIHSIVLEVSVRQRWFWMREWLLRWSSGFLTLNVLRIFQLKTKDTRVLTFQKSNRHVHMPSSSNRHTHPCFPILGGNKHNMVLTGHSHHRQSQPSNSTGCYITLSSSLATLQESSRE